MNNKFRVWCKDKTQWETDYCVLTSDGVLLHRVRNMWVPLNRDTHIVQFDTGLKDKNGKEVYEGDIYHQGDRNILYVVEYTHDCSFMGRQIRTKGSRVGLAYWQDKIEVIGNIYENKELLQN